MKNNLIKSFIIHARKYRETSMIYDVLTEQQGLISILAKGIKSKKDGNVLQPFRELRLSYTDRTLPLLTKYEVESSYHVASNKFMLESLYFNELIYRFIPKNEPLISLYNLYKEHLIYMDSTSDNKLMVSLRFEVLFLKEIGYEVNLVYQEKHILDKKIEYYYKFGEGFKQLDDNIDNRTIVSGESIYNLLNHRFNLISDIVNLRFIAKKLIKEQLGDKDIKSYEMLD